MERGEDPFAIAAWDGEHKRVVFQAGLFRAATVYFADLTADDKIGRAPSGTGLRGAYLRKPGCRQIEPLDFYGASTLDVVPAGTLYYNAKWGGTDHTYKLETDTRNGDGWYWISYTDDEASCGTRSDCVVNDCLERGEAPLISIPMIGWTPKDSVRRWSFSVAKYGAQQETECTQGDPSWCNPDAGNGVLPSGTPLTGKTTDRLLRSRDIELRRQLADPPRFDLRGGGHRAACPSTL